MVPTLLGPTPVLCVVTDRTLVPPDRMPDILRAAILGGVRVVQLREKDLATPDLARLATSLRKALGRDALLIVNGNTEAAALSKADGVHLPEDGPTVSATRAHLAPGALIGRSVHSREAALRAKAEGVDYLIVGTIYQTRSHLGKVPDGIGLLRDVAGAVDIPILATGGINQINAAAVIRAGACGAAVISAVLGSSDPRQAAAAMMSAMRAASASPGAGTPPQPATGGPRR